MSLRTRLIIAFLLLSVVPLTAVTLLSYGSSVRAFERAAEREARDSASDVSRRMELLTADLGRRMDRLWLAGTPPEGGPRPDPRLMRESVAPMLGETAALVDRMEFHPAAEADSTTGNVSVPPPMPPPPGRPPDERRGRGGPPHPNAPHPPPPPGVIVMDVPAIVQEAMRAATTASAAAGTSATASAESAGAAAAGARSAAATLERLGPAIQKQIGSSIEKQLEQLASSQEALKAATLTRQPADQSQARIPVQLEGKNFQIAVRRDGRLLGRANATLNMDRTLRTVLGLARREQGEIPFAIDHSGAMHTPNPADRARLTSLGVEQSAPASAESGQPRRLGDWMLVARKDPTGIIFGIARPIGESLREIRRAAVRNLALGLLVVALAFVGIVPLSHRMTLHLSSLTAGVRQLAGGDFKTRVPVRSSDEFGALATSFNQMAEDLERHQTLVVEQERLRRELELSRRIQTEMLPREPLRSGAAEIAGISIPAREVGGDFFNYFLLPDGRLALLVGDVSGKGVSAALLMANIQATLRARLPHETDLAELADRLDRELEQNTPRSVYLTLFLGILEMDGHTLRYVNAGHNPQFVLRSGGGIEPLGSTGMPIALYAGHGYRESRVSLASGDMLFFYTDGLVEAENESGDMFGAERLQTLLAAEHTGAVDEILHSVDDKVRAFRGKAEPFDDATMMVLRISDL
jgi:serine phosphatase RsbU (regulator of sigma subunit)